MRCLQRGGRLVEDVSMCRKCGIEPCGLKELGEEKVIRYRQDELWALQLHCERPHYVNLCVTELVFTENAILLLYAIVFK
jgi:hypothetical protein